MAGGPAWLVGSSMGGALALEAALAHPAQVAGLVLLAPAVGGAPAPDVLDPATQRLSDLIDANLDDLDEVNLLETWLWLDGPLGPEGRVGGPARRLVLDMNGIGLRATPTDSAPGMDTWERLAEIGVPTTLAWGTLDVPFVVERCHDMHARLPHWWVRTLPDTAHLPYLERPDLVGDLVEEAITRSSGTIGGS